MSYLDGYLKRKEVVYAVLFLKEGFYFSEDSLYILMDIIYDMNERNYFLLLGFSLLPNSFHIIIRPEKKKDLNTIIKGIKKRTTAKLKKEKAILLSPWLEKIEIRYVTSREELLSILNTIHKLPVEKGLVSKEERYRYSSSYPANPTDLEGIW